jgi:hypothetical protein
MTQHQHTSHCFWKALFGALARVYLPSEISKYGRGSSHVLSLGFGTKISRISSLFSFSQFRNGSSLRAGARCVLVSTCVILVRGDRHTSCAFLIFLNQSCARRFFFRLLSGELNGAFETKHVQRIDAIEENG